MNIIERIKIKWLHHVIIYLRKSRQDDPTETVEEVLAKHEALLQEYCEREFGGRVPEENIYREVVSGESIAAREEVRKVLARIEDPAITGVVVVEPSRLSRGDLADCAQLMNSLRFSHTVVYTPMMSYNLEHKMERKFFQDELLRGNDYLEYTKEILARGRVSAVKRGCFIGHRAPYGYNKIKIGKDHTLEPNDDADTVRMIFAWYVEDDLTPLQIARKLNELKVKPPKGEKWVKDGPRYILNNIHYTGKVAYYQTRLTMVMEYGALVKKHLKQPDDEVIIAEGKHAAIIDPETWEKAQTKAHPPRTRSDLTLTNPLARVLFCSKCGRALKKKGYKDGTEDRYVCRSSPVCFRSVKVCDALAALIFALENSELPELETKLQNGDGNARKIQERLVAKLEKKMEEYRAQEDRQYELLEKGKYTEDVFDKRNAALRAEMEECQTALYKARAVLPDSVNYEERIVALKDAIAMLKDPDATAEEKNRMVRAIVDRIEYTGTPGTGSNRKDQYHKGPAPFTLDVKLRL